MRHVRRVSVLNQKGGVGKSTTTVNLAAALAQGGLRVLVVDLDAQRNATQFLGLADFNGPWGTAQFVFGEGAFQPRRDVLLPGLDVVPATDESALIEGRLLERWGSGAHRLRRAIDGVAGDYDFIVTDCGPTLGALAINAVVACPEVLVPIELAPAAAMGALTLAGFLRRLALEEEPSIRILGVLGTFAESRERTPGEVLASLGQLFGSAVFDTVIHASAAVRDAAGRGSPVVLDAPNSRGAEEYLSLTLEVVCRGSVTP